MAMAGESDEKRSDWSSMMRGVCRHDIGLGPQEKWAVTGASYNGPWMEPLSSRSSG